MIGVGLPRMQQQTAAVEILFFKTRVIVVQSPFLVVQQNKCKLILIIKYNKVFNKFQYS